MHKPGKIVLTNDQTLYLAGGAVVKAGVLAQGSNIRIAGRGILDGSDWEWRKGPTPCVVSIRGTNVEVSGITIRGASHWTIVPRDSRHVTVRDVKLCGSRVQNDDGINPCNSQDVLITDCFIRSDDDCVALKGLDLDGPNSNVERITVENCMLWCDRARIFLLGHESRAAFMRDVTLRNLDIIHFSMTPFLFEPGEEMRLEDVTVENVRMHGEGQRELIRLKPVVNQYMRNKVPGHIRDIRFRNLTVSGQPGAYKIQVMGADEHTRGARRDLRERHDPGDEAHGRFRPSPNRPVGRRGALLARRAVKRVYRMAAFMAAKRLLPAATETGCFARALASSTSSLGSSARNGEGWQGMTCPYFLRPRQ